MTLKRRKKIVGNWKMNGSTVFARTLVSDLLEQLSPALTEQVCLCPPMPYLPMVAEALGQSGVSLGAQNVSSYNDGAYTGEVSATMLADIGCDHVIVGHSERRTLFAETDAIVVSKVAKALEQPGLTPILCVGETREEREAGQWQAVISRQMQAVLEGIDRAGVARIIVAYEPVWAIGTGLTATAEQAQEVHALIRQQVAALDSAIADSLLILYGGSLNDQNAKELLSQPDIDGGLVGGAALVAEKFARVCNTLAEVG
ncbi:triose-phosphate isomerase [Pokkaliibacter sp. CJK22405]|uniref:triose-phosphate isomerase n=1 Tax=Pokkaliibacter sp. CJK22405 TaxID=3384615 RepID=UPI003984F491